MKITTYHIDAFTNKLFSGNPAAVCILDEWLPEELLKNIAAENNLPATAFLVRENNHFATRWFGPDYEIDLCGHGSLASGYLIFNILEPSWHEVDLYHPVVGLLKIQRQENLIVLNLPLKTISPCESSQLLTDGLGITPKEVYEFKKERMLVVLETETQLKALNPTMHILQQLAHRGIIVTAKAENVDFVSRVFYPKKTLSEDPFTGSSYCLLAPYWAAKLNKTKFAARQLSKRGGQVICELDGHSVRLYGNAILYKRGEIIL